MISEGNPKLLLRSVVPFLFLQIAMVVCCVVLNVVLFVAVFAVFFFVFFFGMQPVVVVWGDRLC